MNSYPTPDQAIPSITAPGPKLLDLLRSLTGLRDNPLRFLQDAADRYGELVHFKVGPLHAFVLSGPADIQHVLQDNNRSYTKDTVQYNALAEVTGRGLLTSDGETWLRQRRRMQPAFHRQRIQRFGPLISAAAANTVASWEDGQVIDLDREMMMLALEILGKALFGVDLRSEAPAAPSGSENQNRGTLGGHDYGSALTSAVLVALDHTVHTLKSPSLLPGFIPTPEKRRFHDAMQTLDRAVQEIVAAHQDAAGEPGSAERGDLLTSMLQPVDEAPPMTGQQVRDELITILIAGHETVASALTWTCYLLSQNPAAEERLRLELEAVLHGSAPEAADLDRLDFTRRVFDEALRLYPPAWLLTRKNIKEDCIRGVRIPPGSLMVIAVSAAHRNPAFWSDPDRFDPDRFLPEAATGRPRFAYLPFGGGPRLCIGNHFALTEAPLVLASIYQRCHLEVEPGREVIVEPLVTLRPRGGLPMRVTTQHSHLQ